jgi:archaellum component FlaG (FlaF/FlaG flagellin family)
MVMDYVTEGDLVFRVYSDGTGNETAKAVHCAVERLVITGAGIGVVNTPVSLRVEFKDWQDNPLPEENREITITIDGEVEEPQTITLTPAGGVAEFDFIGEVPGTYGITAETQGITHDRGFTKVVIS